MLLSQIYGYPNSTEEEATNIPEIKKEVGHHFFDPQKNKISFLLTMVNTNSVKVLPDYINKPCWWCGYEFDTSPIGLPLRYHTAYKNNPYVVEYEAYMMKNSPKTRKRVILIFLK